MPYAIRSFLNGVISQAYFAIRVHTVFFPHIHMCVSYRIVSCAYVSISLSLPIHLNAFEYLQ